jgi:enoyl-CoA hydratase
LTDQVVRLERPAAHIALVTIDRPQARNAVNAAVTAALGRVLQQTEEDTDTWLIVLTGAGGQSFCSGADLKAVASGGGRGFGTREGGFGGFTHAPRTKPWIAAVDGVALAGGLEIALACDFIVAGETALFGLPETLRGLIPAAGGAYRLPRVLPRAVAFEMIATGEPIGAQRALDLGLVNSLAPAGAVVEAALVLAQRILKASPIAVRESLQLARAAYDATDADLRKASADANRRLAQSADFSEGPRAFVEKRAPRWEGR